MSPASSLWLELLPSLPVLIDSDLKAEILSSPKFLLSIVFVTARERNIEQYLHIP